MKAFVASHAISFAIHTKAVSEKLALLRSRDEITRLAGSFAATNPNRGLIKYMPSISMPVLIKLLLDHGWDIDEGAGRRTLLHHDANHGHESRVRILLDHGADLNIKDVAGRTALHLIAARGVGGEAIRAMVKAGADVNARDNEGNTPLDLARLAKRQAATKELIVLGAEEPS